MTNEPKTTNKKHQSAGAIQKVYGTIVLLLLTHLFSTQGFAAGRVEPGALKLETQGNVDAIPDEVSDSTEDAVSAAKEPGKRSAELVVAPLPSRSPLLGWTIGLPAMYIYKPANANSKDKPWVSGIGTFYTQNDSYGIGAFHKMSLGGDRWRFMASAFAAEINYDYFGIGGDQNFVLPIEQSVNIGIFEGLRRVRPNLFVGLRYVYSDTDAKTTIGADVAPPEVPPITLAENYTISQLAPRIVLDSRDNEFYPRAGWLVEGQVGFGIKEVGSDTEYQSYELALNNYLSLGEKTVLASRIATEYISGDVPFFLYPAFGSDSDLRGYETGTYRDRYLFAAQVEFRYRLTARNGVVGFAGIGTVADDFGQADVSLPSIGFGYRLVIAPKNDLSLRVDAAWGRGDREFYVGLGEAF